MTATASANPNGARSVDRRVERTRHRLREALLDLANERPLAEITVSDVAERANINRATVYLHFTDRDHLLAEALRIWIDESARIAADCCPADLAFAEMATPAPMRELFTRFDLRRKLFATVLGPNGSARINHELRAVVSEHVLVRMRQQGGPDAVADAVRADFLSGALIGLLAGWLSAPEPLPADTVAHAAWQLVRKLS